MTTITDLPQGDPRLLDTDVARLAHVVADGTPRVPLMMFHVPATDIVGQARQ